MIEVDGEKQELVKKMMRNKVWNKRLTTKCYRRTSYEEQIIVQEEIDTKDLHVEK